MSNSQPPDFWRSVLRAYLGKSGVNSEKLFNKLNARHVDFGNFVHCTEFLGYLLKKSALNISDNQLAEKVVQQYVRTWAFNNRINKKLNEISCAANGELDFIFLKGSTFLREGRYPPGTRRLSDIDLLVKKSQLHSWYELLQNLKFEPHRDLTWILDESHSQYVSSTFFDGGKNNDLRIDLHWHLVDFPARRAVRRWNWDMEPFWEASENHHLSAEHRILYQADHAFTHSFRRWKWGVDLVILENQLDYDPERLRQEARRLKLEKILNITKNFVDRLLGCDWLDELSSQNRTSLDSLKKSFIKRGLENKNRDSDYLIICFRMFHSWKEYLIFLRWIVLPPVSALSDIRSLPSIKERLSIYISRIRTILFEGFKLLRA